ncbi:MAG: hypothetical protein J6O50_06425 [Ruminiclostridium sp.]|nr:hypothetical protein [Ruminiclostridium sp.]
MAVFRKIISVMLTAVIAAGAILAFPAEASNVTNNMYTAKYNLIVKALYNDEETMKAVKDFGRAVVFISVSDGHKKAKVFLSQSYDLSKALSEAFAKAKKSAMVPKWFKLDVVTSDEEKSYLDFTDENAGIRNSGMRKGIAFTPYYGTALLEAQINSSGMLNYETGELDLKRVNEELAAMGKKRLSSIPETLRLFTTQGYFAENKAFAYKLADGTYNNGRRKITADRKTVENLAQKTSEYLSSIIDSKGKFIYGYYPIDNEELEGYNILRHAGTIWSLIMQYDMCRDERLVPVIDSAIGYLRKSIIQKDSKIAFVADGSRLNVGGNGLALLALTTYEEVFCTSKYNSLIRKLANGIIFMQKKDGSFTHTIHKNTYKTAEEYIIVYYDGEAAYGLLKAYGVVGDKKFLTAASKAADYFVDQDYVSLHSHWMSYVFNEITKYLPYERYFEFGLKNADADDFSVNMFNSKGSSNVAAETLNASLELYSRLINGGYECAYLDTFDDVQLVKASIRRAELGFNFFMYPEYAMYFKAPDTVVNSMAIRDDSFRIRIDDIQHFLDGYYLYWKNYDTIMEYKDNPPSARPKPEPEPADGDENTEETGAGEGGEAAADGEQTDAENGEQPEAADGEKTDTETKTEETA